MSGPSPSGIHDLMSQADDLMESQQWELAEIVLLRAKAQLAVMPEGSRGASTVGWDRRAIDDLIDRVRAKRQAKNTCITQIPYERVRPGAPSRGDAC